MTCGSLHVALLTGVDEVLVGQPGVVHVVYGRGEQGGQLLQWREHGFQGRRAEQHAGGLHHVSGMGPVVVGHLPQVVALQRGQEREERAGPDLERAQQVPLLCRGGAAPVRI